jgi:hypothetical protein
MKNVQDTQELKNSSEAARVTAQDVFQDIVEEIVTNWESPNDNLLGQISLDFSATEPLMRRYITLHRLRWVLAFGLPFVSLGLMLVCVHPSLALPSEQGLVVRLFAIVIAISLPFSIGALYQHCMNAMLKYIREEFIASNHTYFAWQRAKAIYDIKRLLG